MPKRCISVGPQHMQLELQSEIPLIWAFPYLGFGCTSVRIGISFGASTLFLSTFWSGESELPTAPAFVSPTDSAGSRLLNDEEEVLSKGQEAALEQLIFLGFRRGSAKSGDAGAGTLIGIVVLDEGSTPSGQA
ncbi:hypothetical protein B0H14DRAFT_2567893 [Mycena olivaceomarginata]|nr:hypothetical protein B0H14DRAFT_2567893 [Mycena olivaceomarginata]